MAFKNIEFDAEKLIGEVDILQKVQIPYATEQALKRFGFLFAKQQVKQDMRDEFNNPVPLTLNSVKYEAKGLEVTFRVKDKVDKGNAPGKYLYPVSTEDGGGRKPIYETRFTTFLRKFGIVKGNYWPVPFLAGTGVTQNAYGRMSPGQYQQVVNGLKSGTGKGGYRYVSVPDQSKPRQTSNLKPGIYRIKGRDNVQMLFTYARTKPQVNAKFDMRQYALDYAEDVLPSLLSKALERAMRS